MQSTDESDLELTVKQSAALLKLEVTLLNMAETGYAKLQPDESIEIHVHREVTGIVANLREIIVNHDLPFEAYESLIDSYVGKLRDNFRTTIVEAALGGQDSPNKERARKVEYLSSLYVQLLDKLQDAEHQRTETLEQIYAIYERMRRDVFKKYIKGDTRFYDEGISIEDGDAEVERLCTEHNVSKKDLIGVIKDYLRKDNDTRYEGTKSVKNDLSWRNRSTAEPSKHNIEYKKILELEVAELEQIRTYLTDKIKYLEGTHSQT